MNGHQFADGTCRRCGLSQADFWLDRDMYRDMTSGRCVGVPS